MSSISNFWNKHKKVIIIGLILAAVAIVTIILLICYFKLWRKKKESFSEHYVTLDDTKDEKIEPFTYVKKWIDACIGVDNKTMFAPRS